MGWLSLTTGLGRQYSMQHPMLVLIAHKFLLGSQWRVVEPFFCRAYPSSDSLIYHNQIVLLIHHSARWSKGLSDQFHTFKSFINKGLVCFGHAFSKNTSTLLFNFWSIVFPVKSKSSEYRELTCRLFLCLQIVN